MSLLAQDLGACACEVTRFFKEMVSLRALGTPLSIYISNSLEPWMHALHVWDVRGMFEALDEVFHHVIGIGKCQSGGASWKPTGMRVKGTVVNVSPPVYDCSVRGTISHPNSVYGELCSGRFCW